ncbi:glycosyltransferase family 2 protein [Brevibacterium sp. SMBL_HHYL_HB1]|uniref:glycosyltransferase family 2 protein n=1 Tax=Brevibacterium sp. SMBL_HHYL_HB1 TaxID=2777556 RepID=UPI001BAD50A0|nr:glycosyltransferase family 2 protein [Brevibacterium sp. SMBL_HHYL_HB1]QUL79689.1 glycosyltransferase [Brevibacterium sp. SMBL_HHYL_HB1]
MPAPVVSVVIAAKNAEATIGGSLTSLVNQNFDAGDLEVIVVNDGSTDDTVGVVGEFSDRLTLIEIDNPVSRGVSAARNTALEASTGQTITYLDADDWYAPGHLRSLTDAITGLGVDFVKTNYLIVNGFNRKLRRAPCAQHNTALDPRDFILPHDASTMVDFPECWTGIYSRSMAERGLLDFDPELRTCEDRPWTWRHHLEADSFAVVDTAGLCYRKGSSTSLTAVFDERQLDFIPAFRSIFAMLEAGPDLRRFEQKAVRNFLSILYFQIVNRGSSMTRAVREMLNLGAVNTLRSVGNDVIDLALTNFGDRRLPVIDPIVRTAR